MDNSKLVYTPAEVSEILGVGRLLIYRMLKAGTLKGVRAGDKWLVGRQSLINYVNGDQSQVKC